MPPFSCLIAGLLCGQYFNYINVYLESGEIVRLPRVSALHALNARERAAYTLSADKSTVACFTDTVIL